MKRILILAGAALLATPALAQDAAIPDAATDCAAFTELDTEAQTAALMGLDPEAGDKTGDETTMVEESTPKVVQVCTENPQLTIAEAVAQAERQ